MAGIEVRGIGRGGKHEICVYFNQQPTDDDVRLVHDVLRDGLARGDAYRGARDDLEEWKNRALLAEATLLRMCADHNSVNGPMRFGEPVLGA